MKKRILSLLAVISVLISSVAASYSVFADDTDWSYDADTKTLVISGYGPMDDYDDEFSAPWFNYIHDIEHFIVRDGVTSVGEYAVAGADKLVDVSLSDSVSRVEAFAFSSCENLLDLSFSSAVTYIADSSFYFNGVTAKNGFTLHCEAGSYALNFAFRCNIPFVADSVKCGTNVAHIVVGGMYAYFPYLAKVSGKFEFYSVGNHDTYGVVYDSNHTAIASNDDSTSANTNFKVTVDLVKGKLYYFAVKIYNTTIKANITTYLNAVDYTVSGRIMAMNDPSGAASDIVLSDALIDSQESGGVYSYHLTQPRTVTVSCGNVTERVVLSADSDEDIVLMMCDVNGDRVVNGKDFAALHRSNSPYETLFKNFMMYRY